MRTHVRRNLRLRVAASLVSALIAVAALAPAAMASTFTLDGSPAGNSLDGDPLGNSLDGNSLDGCDI